MVLRLAALPGELGLPGGRLRQQERRRPDEVDLRARSQQARRGPADGDPEREHQADLAGHAEEQDQLLGRAAEPPLDQRAGGDVFARDLSGLAVQPRVADHRGVDGPRDQPSAPRGEVRQPRRGLRGQVPRGRRPVPARDSGARSDDRVPLSRKGLLLSAGVLRHAERAVHAAGVGLGVLHHGLACAQGRLPERLRYAGAATARQRAGAVLHLQQRRAERDPAARPAVYPDDALVARHGHLRSGPVDVQTGDDQRRRTAGRLQEQVPGADARARPRSCRTATS